jgi:hypothetical protein
MNKIINISKNLNLCAGVCRSIFKAAVWIIAVSIVILLFVSPHHDMWRNGTFTLELGQVTLDLVPDSAVSPEATRNGVIGGLIFCIPVLLFAVKCLSIVQEILRPMAEGKPFDANISRSLRKLSFLIPIGCAVAEAGELLLSTLRLRNFPLDALFNPELVAGYTVNYVLEGNFVLIFAALYLMSHVFRYGEELQQLSDETL